jgi:hypothetical protein
LPHINITKDEVNDVLKVVEDVSLQHSSELNSLLAGQRMQSEQTTFKFLGPSHQSKVVNESVYRNRRQLNSVMERKSKKFQ